MSNDEKQITILLKNPMKTFDNKVIPDASLVDIEKRKTIQNQDELDAMSPPMTIGAMLGTMFSTSIKPTDGAHAAKLQRMARKVHNKLITAKGEWKVDKKELQDIIATISEVQSGLAAPKFVGEVINTLEDLLFEEERKEHQQNAKKD